MPLLSIIALQTYAITVYLVMHVYASGNLQRTLQINAVPLFCGQLTNVSHTYPLQINAVPLSHRQQNSGTNLYPTVDQCGSIIPRTTVKLMLMPLPSCTTVYK